MRDNPKGSELDSAVDDHRRCKNSPVLSCIDKWTKKGCDRGSQVGTVHSDGSGATLPLPRDRGVEKLHKTQQSGHAPRSGLKVKNGSSAKDGAPERLRCGTIQKVVS